MSAMNEQRIVGAGGPKADGDGMTLARLRARRDEVLRVVAAHDAHNVRVFGSVARGGADAGSDVDLLVDIATDARGFAYFGLLEDLRRELIAVLGCEVDVVDSAGLSRLRDPILREAVPL
jgi:predicted nucleotidyltransferase